MRRFFTALFALLFYRRRPRASSRRRVIGIIPPEVMAFLSVEERSRFWRGWLPSMAGGAQPFPYNINNLLGGRVRILWADGETGGAAIPTGPKDVFAQADPYGPVGAGAAAWKDFGAGKDPSTYGRNIDVEGWEIQQANSAIVEQVNEITRTVTVSMAELNETTLAIFEGATTTGTVAPVTGQSAQKTVGMGIVTSLKRYRIAFASMRDRASGIVTEPVGAGGGTRGRFVVGVGWSAAVSADNAELEQAKSTLSAVSLTFKFYPVTSQPSGEEFGKWFFEDAGTIT